MVHRVRQPKGVPVGGQFSVSKRGESDVLILRDKRMPDIKVFEYLNGGCSLFAGAVIHRLSKAGIESSPMGVYVKLGNSEPTFFHTFVAVGDSLCVDASGVYKSPNELLLAMKERNDSGWHQRFDPDLESFDEMPEMDIRQIDLREVDPWIEYAAENNPDADVGILCGGCVPESDTDYLTSLVMKELCD